MPVTRVRRIVRGVAVLVACVGSTQSALAQGGSSQNQPSQRERGDRGQGQRRGFGGFGGRGMFEASITSKAVDGYVKTLGLSTDQQAAAKALLEGYQQSFSTLSQDARDKMREMRESIRAEMAENGPSPAAFRKIGDEMDKFRKERDKLDQGFLNDLKAVLTPDQASKWPAVEQAFRREHSIGRGVISGERVDLVEIVGQLKLSDDAMKPISPVLDQYAADLDRELAARDVAYDAAQAKVREMFQAGGDGGGGGSGGGDDAAMNKAWEDGRAAGLRVRDVNRRYARQIEPLLPAVSQPAFDTAVREQSYPLIYRPSHASRVVAAAGELSGLSDDQKATIRTISDSFNRDLAAVNKELEAATEKRESSLKPQDLMPRRFGGGGGGGGAWDFFGDPEVSKLIERRSTLQDSAIEKLKAALTPEQFDSLPQRRDRAVGGPEAGDGGDNAEPPRSRGRRGAPPREERPAAPKFPSSGPSH